MTHDNQWRKIQYRARKGQETATESRIGRGLHTESKTTRSDLNIGASMGHRTMKDSRKSREKAKEPERD